MKASMRSVLHRLSQSPACPQDFAADIHTARYSARILELRKLGYVITREKCDRHAHNNYIEMYRLVASPQADGQVALAVGTGR